MKDKVVKKFYNLKTEIGFHIQNKLDLNKIFDDDDNKRLALKKIINKRGKQFGILYKSYGKRIRIYHCKWTHAHGDGCFRERYVDSYTTHKFEKRDNIYVYDFSDSPKIDVNLEIDYMKKFYSRKFFVESTPLNFAIFCENSQAINFLLENGANPDTTDELDNNPYVFAKYMKNENIENILDKHYISKSFLKQLYCDIDINIYYL